MNTYTAILRGINVSGKNKIKMAALKEALESAGFKSVQTYIQSGNIIFQEQEVSAIQLAKKISLIIKKEWDFDVPTLVLTQEELTSAKENNPFWRENPDIDTSKLYVTFMENVPNDDLIEAIALPPNCNDFFTIKGKHIFVFCPTGYGRTKLTNNFFERKLKQVCTTRNWKTINKLIELSI